MDYEDYSAQFTSYLKNGEKIYWMGKPLGGWRRREFDLILIPMSIILCGFTGLLDYIVISYNAFWLFKGMGILLTYASFYMGFYRFYKDKRRREHTFYCLTNKRLLVKMGSNRKPKMYILAITDIKYAVLNEDKNGYGHIVFNNNNPVFSWLFGSFVFAGTDIPGLEMIPHVKNVYALFKKVQDDCMEQLQNIHPN